MPDHFLTRAKAYAALIGSVLTVLGSQIPDDPTTQKWLGIGLALCTALATFRIPNKPAPKNEGGYADAGFIILVLTFVGVLLLLFRVHLGG